jgi:hypothetical protein
MEFWVDDDNGDIVWPGGSNAGETATLELNGPTPSIARE